MAYETVGGDRVFPTYSPPRPPSALGLSPCRKRTRSGVATEMVDGGVEGIG
ncbi:MAG: hypothetical protein ACRCY9_06075 [Phycicoccus sp.]